MQISQSTQSWIRIGKLTKRRFNPGRKKLRINSIYNVECRNATVGESLDIYAQSNVVLLKQMLKKQPLGLLYIIFENAMHYRSKMTREFSDKNPEVKFIYFPYSPNLYFIERLWKFFKKKITFNTYYEKFSMLKKKSTDFFNVLRFTNRNFKLL